MMTTTPLEPRVPTIRRRETLTQGKKYDYVRLHVTTPTGAEMTREVVRHPGAVVVVAITDAPDRRVVLIRNFRIALAAGGGPGQWLYECCAGTIERERLGDGSFGTSEDPGACAGRELIEETGYQASRIEPLGTFWTTPGLTNELMHAFVATGLTHVGQRLEPDEQIQVELVPGARVLAMIDSGELRDAKSMLAVLMAHRRGLLGA